MSPNLVEIWIQRPTHTHREKATEGEGRDVDDASTCQGCPGMAENHQELREGPACHRFSLAVPGPATVWTSRLMNHETVHFCHLSSSVCGTVLQ